MPHTRDIKVYIILYVNSHKLNILFKLYVEMFLFMGPQFRRREIYDYVIGDILRLFSVKVKGGGGSKGPRSSVFANFEGGGFGPLVDLFWPLSGREERDICCW